MSVVKPGPLAPARELLAELLLKLNRPSEALKEFEATLIKEPNRFRSLYAAAEAAKLAGDRSTAQTYFRRLLTVADRLISLNAGKCQRRVAERNQNSSCPNYG